MGTSLHQRHLLKPLIRLSSDLSPQIAAGSDYATRTGRAAGFGFEYGFAPNWTAKAEWLHWDLGNLTYNTDPQ